MRTPLNAVIICCLALQAAAQNPQQPRVFLLNASLLAHERQRMQTHPASDSDLVRAARVPADKAMQVAPLSVMQKNAVPPSGDKHDYMSLAPYFWPDPKSPTGLPYIRRDGERNPEIKQISDHDNMGKLCSAVRDLAIGYFLTGKEDYAAHAVLLLRTWFLDPATRMNPNLEFAQGIKGTNTGRGIGIIETVGLTDVVDAAGLLDGSRNWSRADSDALRQWFSKYLDWLCSSAHGQDESNAKNNHGTFYDVQVMDFALFVGRRDIAAEIARNGGEKRIAAQIEPDGKQPLELARTNSFHYSAYNLRALAELATLAKEMGVDLWNFQTPDGRSIRRALNFLVPYATGEKKWPYQEIEALNPNELAVSLLRAASAYKDPHYRAAAEKIVKDNGRLNLLLPQTTAQTN